MLNGYDRNSYACAYNNDFVFFYYFHMLKRQNEKKMFQKLKSFFKVILFFSTLNIQS